MLGDKLIPQEDWMLLEPEEPETSLAMPETMARDVTAYEAFKVIEIGPWQDYFEFGKRIPHDVKKGDIVILEGMSAPEFTYNHVKYYTARARRVVFMVQKGGKDEGAEPERSEAGHPEDTADR